MDTLQKFQNQEMSGDDLKIYLADPKMRRELEMDRKDREQSDYDTDLNRTMF